MQEIKGYIEETAKHNKARETTPTTFSVIHIKSNQKPCLETANNQEHLDNSEASNKQELKTENKPEPRRYNLDDFSGVHMGGTSPRIGTDAESADSPDSQAAKANPSRKKECGYAKAAKKNGKTGDNKDDVL